MKKRPMPTNVQPVLDWQIVLAETMNAATITFLILDPKTRETFSYPALCIDPTRLARLHADLGRLLEYVASSAAEKPSH